MAIAGKLIPVEVTQPSLLGEEDDDDSSRARTIPADDAPSGSKGKRKAPDEWRGGYQASVRAFSRHNSHIIFWHLHHT